jgi:hypothetical protein
VAYSAEISRSNPTCFLFLIDQSGSMEDEIGDGDVRLRKRDVVADALNRLLSELAIKCAKEEGVRDYFHVSVIGYGDKVGPALGGLLAGRDILPISEIAASPDRIEERTKKVSDGAGGLVEQTVKFPIWMSPVSNGGTPMTEALTHVQRIVGAWLSEHPSCFPPVILHLTDGESTDGDPTAAAESIRSLASTDGATLLFNLHVSSDRSAPVAFPDSDAALPNEFAKLLFSMSSFLPDQIRRYAEQQGFRITDATRGFVFNADVSAVVQFLDIGTRASNLR